MFASNASRLQLGMAVAPAGTKCQLAASCVAQPTVWALHRLQAPCRELFRRPRARSPLDIARLHQLFSHNHPPTAQDILTSLRPLPPQNQKQWLPRLYVHDTALLLAQSFGQRDHGVMQ